MLIENSLTQKKLNKQKVLSNVFATLIGHFLTYPAFLKQDSLQRSGLTCNFALLYGGWEGAEVEERGGSRTLTRKAPSSSLPGDPSTPSKPPLCWQGASGSSEKMPALNQTGPISVVEI